MIEMIVEQVLTRPASPAPDEQAAAGPGPILLLTGDEQTARLSAEPELPAVQRVVVLKEKAGERRLPIWIGPYEADMLAMQLAGQAAPRPLTYELMLSLAEAAGGQMAYAAIASVQAGVFHAEIAVQAGGQAHLVDARPSDALNLALRAGAPIRVAVEVLEAHGVSAEGLAEALARQAGQGARFAWGGRREEHE